MHKVQFIFFNRDWWGSVIRVWHIFGVCLFINLCILLFIFVFLFFNEIFNSLVEFTLLLQTNSFLIRLLLSFPGAFLVSPTPYYVQQNCIHSSYIAHENWKYILSIGNRDLRGNLDRRKEWRTKKGIPIYRPLV